MSARKRNRVLLNRSRLRDGLVVLCLIFSNSSALFLSLGLGIFLLGVALHFWTKGVLRRNEVLVITGPYALCRHPFYLANLIIDVSICLMAGLPQIIPAYIIIFLWVYVPSARREEAFLKHRFPDVWPALERRFRFFPLLPRRWEMLRAPWRLTTILREREASRVLRLLAIPFLVAWAVEIREGWWEVVDVETLALVGSALFLHLAGRFVYQNFERSERPFGHSNTSVATGLAAVGIGLCVVIGIYTSQTQGEATTLARQHGAHLVGSTQQLAKISSLRRPGLYLVSDEILEQSHRKQKRAFGQVDTVWYKFRIYHLLRCNPTDSASDRTG